MEMNAVEVRDVINLLHKSREEKTTNIPKYVKGILQPLDYESAAQVLSECRKNHKKLVPLIESTLKYMY